MRFNLNPGKAVEFLLLAALPGLILCVIPREGMEFRFMWQLVSIWLAGIAFVFLLPNNWYRLIFFLALLQVAWQEPALNAYLSLLMIAIFLAAAYEFERINADSVMSGICLAAIVLLVWMVAQGFGILPIHGIPLVNPKPVGPFNPDSAGIFLALCLPAALRRAWWPLVPFIVLGIVVSGTSTGALAAAFGITVLLWLKFTRNRKYFYFGVLAIAGLIAVWLWKVETVSIFGDPRWIVWKHALRSLPVEWWGRGLGSWQDIFPLLASGDPRIGQVTNTAAGLEMKNVWTYAHNEYIQVAFELGIQTLLVVFAFVSSVFYLIIRGEVSPSAAAGITVLIVSCFGFFVMHEAPTALLGCAWMGIWFAAKGKGQREETR